VAATLLYDSPTDFLKFLYLKGGKFYLIEPLKKETQEEVFNLGDEQNERIIFISEDDLKKYLFKMREQKFNGAVLVFSTKDFSDLKKEYPILKAAKGSHEAFQFPLEISTLLTKVDSLRSILEGNMRHLGFQIREYNRINDDLFKRAQGEIDNIRNQPTSSKEILFRILKDIADDYPCTNHDIKLTTLQDINEIETALTKFRNELNEIAENLDI
jgi:hypothetical protein